MKRTLRRLAPVLLLGLALAGNAWARAGGGHSFSGGGSHSSGGGSHYSGGGSHYSGGGSFGGGGGDSDGAALLVWLLFEEPQIGIPLLIVVAVVVSVQKSRQAEGRGRVVTRTDGFEDYTPPAPRAPRGVTLDLAPLVATDPDFSLPLFLDMARLVYTRAQEQSANLEPLSAYLAPDARRTIVGALQRGKVSDVCIGATQLAAFQTLGGWHRLKVRFESNLAVTGADGAARQHHRVEVWDFGRKVGARSPGPERLQELRCPACGNASEARPDGTCTRCDAVINDGRLMWLVREVLVATDERVPRVALTLGGGVEDGVELPTLPDPALAANLRRLGALQPDFTPVGFEARAIATFVAIQEAWGKADLRALRPLESDFLYQQHRYWIERYAREGLRNPNASASVRRLDFVRVSIDGYVVAVTVRMFAMMYDWTENATGKVVGGSKDEIRVFSEYWTFVRSVRAPASRDAASPPRACPSCGAPLDRVSDAGTCGYCEARITTGTFDWVLNDIQQDEVWRG